MKKKILAIAVILTLVPVFSITNAQADGRQVRLMNVDKALSEYGVNNSTSFGKVVREKADIMTQMVVGAIEGDSSVDTEQETITINLILN